MDTPEDAIAAIEPGSGWFDPVPLPPPPSTVSLPFPRGVRNAASIWFVVGALLGLASAAGWCAWWYDESPVPVPILVFASVSACCLIGFGMRTRRGNAEGTWGAGFLSLSIAAACLTPASTLAVAALPGGERVKPPKKNPLDPDAPPLWFEGPTTWQKRFAVGSPDDPRAIAVAVGAGLAAAALFVAGGLGMVGNRSYRDWRRNSGRDPRGRPRSEIRPGEYPAFIRG